ncbi:MAG: diacylglycerol kinase [Chthoniobacter sp.]|jgi:diacylglycerol kinase (ATP)|nr:diacylglycerol kinase [Chthoniobacter sp.]
MPELPPANPPTRGRLARSFGYAFRGVRAMVVTQANARLHLGATVAVLVLGFVLELARWEWCAIVGAIGLVWAVEGVNTALEAVVDLASPQQHPLAGRAKDIAAGAVLCAAISAAIVGAVIFLPKLAAWF